MSYKTDKYDGILTALNIFLPIFYVIIVIIASNIIFNAAPVVSEEGYPILQETYNNGYKVANVSMITGIIFTIITISAPFILKSDKKIIHIVPTIIILTIIAFVTITINANLA